MKFSKLCSCLAGRLNNNNASNEDVLELDTLLGRGTSFVGKLTFDTRTRIDGKFQGEIVSDGVLILGDTAEIDANVLVGALIVRGATVRGTLRATQIIEVYAPAKVYGDLSAPEVVIEKGVVMEGRVKMGPVDLESPAAQVASAALSALDSAAATPTDPAFGTGSSEPIEKAVEK